MHVMFYRRVGVGGGDLTSSLNEEIEEIISVVVLLRESAVT